MNWIRENKFLAGFFGVLAVGVIALGVLLFLAFGHYSDVTSTYDSQLAELQRLEGLKPYPNAANLEKVNEQKAIYNQEVLALRRRLSDQNYPLEETSPSEFQDDLRQAVGDVIGLAKEKDVELTEGFYLGFDIYQAQPPKPEAAGLLARELKLVKLLTDKLIEAGVDQLSMERAPLAIEGNEAPPARKGKGAPKKVGNTMQLVEKNAVTVGFVCDPRVFQDVLNRMSSAEKFLIIRTLSVYNTAPEGPVRGSTVKDEGFDALLGTDSDMAEMFPLDEGGEVAQDATQESIQDIPDGERLEFVVGSEKLKVSMRVEIVDFAPAESGEKATAGGA